MVSIMKTQEERMAPEDVAAHQYSKNHRKQQSGDRVCGYFSFLKIFSPKEITEWIQDNAETAVCPYCGIDSLIGQSSGYPIHKAFLKKMNKYWF